MNPSRAEVAAELRNAIHTTRNQPDTKLRKFRLQALEMLLTQYEGEDG